MIDIDTALEQCRKIGLEVDCYHDILHKDTLDWCLWQIMLALVGSYVKDINIYLPNVKHIKEDIYDDEILIEKAEDICSNRYILNDLGFNINSFAVDGYQQDDISSTIENIYSYEDDELLAAIDMDTLKSEALSDEAWLTIVSNPKLAEFLHNRSEKITKPLMKLLSRFSLTWNDDYVFNDEKILGTDNNRYWLLTSKNVYYAAYTNESSAYEAHLDYTPGSILIAYYLREYMKSFRDDI